MARHPQPAALFWNRWPEMKWSREHWLLTTGSPCFGPVDNQFLENWGYGRPARSRGNGRCSR